MITITKDNIFDLKVEALVCPCNCVGVAGKGLALEFKKRFPSQYKVYIHACKKGYLSPGSIFYDCLEQQNELTQKHVLYFPTKDHWKNNSKYEYISEGLKELGTFVGYCGIKSIAIPALGCGCGGLQWNIVRKLIVSAFQDINDVDVYICEPR